MSESVTKQEVEEIVGRTVDKAVTDLSKIISTFAQQVDVRFNRLEIKVEKIEKELSDLRESHLRLLNTIDGFVARIDHYETDQLMRDNQFKRLLEWARKVSEKTGIPLENL